MCKSGLRLRQKNELFVILNSARMRTIRRSRRVVLSYLSVFQLTVFGNSDMQFTAQIHQTIMRSFLGPSAGFLARARDC